MARGYVLSLVSRLALAGLNRSRWRHPMLNVPLLSVAGAVHLVQARHSSESGQQKSHANHLIKLTTFGQSTYPYDLTEEEENIITEGNAEERIKLYSLLLLLALKREQGYVLPEALSVKEFIELLDCSEDDVDDLVPIYQFRRDRDCKAAELRMQKELKKLQTSKNDECKDEYSVLNYGNDNRIFINVLKTSQSLYYNANMAKGLLFGQKLMLDCSYDSFMSRLQQRQIAKELNSCIRLNRRSRRPFAISLCNVESKSQVMKDLRRENPAIGDDLPVNVHSCSYVDLFRREDIVYLSPYCKHPFVYHPDDIFVLGVLGNIEKPLSLKKVFLDGVRCMRLPLGFKQMVEHNRVLSLFETFETLLSKKNTNVWTHAPEISKPK